MRSQLKALVPLPLRELYHRLKNPENLDREKLALIDLACTELGARALADLGGVWRVNGGYTFYALKRHRPGRAVLVDLSFTPEVRQRAGSYPQLELVVANFALRETAERVGPVDAVLLFDVLLHQVRPDWDGALRNWAAHAKHFVIFNQQFTGPETIRLVELGPGDYFRHVPTDMSVPEYRDLFERLDEPHPFYDDGRTYRDQHSVWQWGITDADLRRVAGSLGFREVYFKNCGPWPGVEQIENHAFIFSR